ncbi:SymE family type I addiction module toxin [Sodalis ligni]|jgi:toxic protein SymE|uniref:SymE family type I addiction module toxin n=1 Tax=Sodalis ligni TaxID=2697027 RepID=UPI00193F6F64|nr:SymE family type I addiction module toxin [Sodalis ligni]QWA10738.1 SymE family type I addiction module toxin [Sodalis ligni]
MAKRDCKSEPVISQALRQSVVGYAPDAYRYPQVKLKGKRLEQAGFLTGMSPVVRVMEGCLVITTQSNSRLNEVLQQSDRLSAQSRLELEQLIQGLALKEKLTEGSRP